MILFAISLLRARITGAHYHRWLNNVLNTSLKLTQEQGLALDQQSSNKCHFLDLQGREFHSKAQFQLKKKKIRCGNNHLDGTSKAHLYRDCVQGKPAAHHYSSPSLENLWEQRLSS